MDKISSDQLRKFQTVYKAGLRWSAIILAEIFISWSLLQYAVKERDYLKYQKWIGAAIIIAALVYVVIAFFTDKEELARIRDFLRRMCSIEQILLIALLVWYIISCAVRSRLDGEPLFKFNDNRLFMFSLSTFLFFPFAELMGKQARRIIEYMIHFTMLIYTPFCAWCIRKYYKVEFFTFPSGLRLENHREGVSMKMGGNINIIAAASVILLGLCLYMLLTQKRAIKIPYIPAAVIHFMVVILTNSRTSYLAMMAMLVVASILFAWDILQNMEIPLRLAGVLLATLLCAVIVMSGQSALLKKFAHVYPESLQKEAEQSTEALLEDYMTEEAAAEAPAEEAAATEEVADTAGTTVETAEAAEPAEAAAEEAVAEEAPAEAPAEETAAAEPAPAPAAEVAQTGETEDGARKMDDLNGRKSVWMFAIQIMNSSKDHYFFGVSPCYVKSWLEKTSRFDRELPHAHNGLLQVGLGLGVPAMLLFLAFELVLIVRCITIVFVRHGKPFRYSWMIPVIIMAILIIELVEAMVFAMVRFNLPAFYMLAGSSVAMCRRIGKNK